MNYKNTVSQLLFKGGEVKSEQLITHHYVHYFNTEFEKK